jgi:cyclopropane fatty-acyl-phospholipid synthase-like methyltransferase
MRSDQFADRAAGWDEAGQRVRNVESIAREMRRRIRFHAGMNIMDFGSGTGLLLERIAPRVASITAVDTSPAMNEQLASKRDALDCALEILAIDLLATDLDRRFDGIISSMTIHHIADIPALFRRFHALLEEGGFIAIADLDTEDGSFHDDSTGVFHQGFDRQALKRVVSDAGFTRVDIATVSVVREARGDYPVFLLTAFS